jgi:hypothetical protein
MAVERASEMKRYGFHATDDFIAAACCMLVRLTRQPCVVAGRPTRPRWRVLDAALPNQDRQGVGGVRN